VTLMKVGHVGMRMCELTVLMLMRVTTSDQRCVAMVVVAVVVAVFVIVDSRLMLVLVLVRPNRARGLRIPASKPAATCATVIGASNATHTTIGPMNGAVANMT
jgi:hypothetical protein